MRCKTTAADLRLALARIATCNVDLLVYRCPCRTVSTCCRTAPSSPRVPYSSSAPRFQSKGTQIGANHEFSYARSRSIIGTLARNAPLVVETRSLPLQCSQVKGLPDARTIFGGLLAIFRVLPRAVARSTCFGVGPRSDLGLGFGGTGGAGFVFYCRTGRVGVELYVRHRLYCGNLDAVRLAATHAFSNGNVVRRHNVLGLRSGIFVQP